MAYDKNRESLKSGKVSQDNECQEGLHKELKKRNKNILRFECSFRRSKLRELDKTLNLNIGELRLKNLFKKDIAQQILTYYSSKIFDGLKRLDLDSSSSIATLDRIQNAYPNATGNKVEKLFAQTTIASQYGIEFLKNRFNYKPSKLSLIRKNLKDINSQANSPYSSTIQNILAVEDCIKEFSLFRPRYWNEE
ncbi:MAG: hypothetical protein JJW01_00995 [Alphaproteobacteria bacterium]|nr:hypothetical protein [Rickettsiales bacterium]